MAKTQIYSRDVYELVENEKGEVMALIYAQEPAPQNATFYLDAENNMLELNRSYQNTLYISGLQASAIQKLKNLKKLYVCEIKYNENKNDENEIIYTYTAALRKTPSQETQKQEDSDKNNLAQKAQNARKKALKESAQ